VQQIVCVGRGFPVLSLIICYTRLNLNLHAVLAVRLNVAPDAEHERGRLRSRYSIRFHNGPVSVSWRWRLDLGSQGDDRRRSNVLANPPFLRKCALGNRDRCKSNYRGDRVSPCIQFRSCWSRRTPGSRLQHAGASFSFLPQPGPSGYPPSTEGWTTPGMQIVDSVLGSLKTCGFSFCGIGGRNHWSQRGISPLTIQADWVGLRDAPDMRGFESWVKRVCGLRLRSPH